MNKKIFIILLVLICALSISTVSATDLDANNGVAVADEGSFSQLQDLIDVSGEKLQLNDSYKYSGSNDKSSININKDFTLDGNGHTIDKSERGAVASIFTIAKDKTVTIKNVNFKSGISTNGGAINNDGNLILIGCNFTSFTATKNGGAIYNNGNLTIENSIFTGNQANNGNGGAIYNNGTLTVKNSEFVTSPDKNTPQDIYNAINKDITLNNTEAKTLVETIMKLDDVKNVSANVPVTISGTVSSEANGKVTITVNGAKYEAEVKDGKFNTTIGGLPFGMYNATVVFTGIEVNGTNYTTCNATTKKFNVTKASVTIDLYDIKNVIQGQKTTIEGKTVGIADGDKVSIILNGVLKEDVPVKDNMFAYNLTTDGSSILGVNNITVKVADSDKYLNSSDNATFKIQSATSINIDTIANVESGKNVTISGTVTGITDGTVTISVNGNKVGDAIVNGTKFNYNVTAEDGGLNNVTVIFAGDDTHAESSANTTFNVTNVTTSIKLLDTANAEFGKNVTIKGETTGIPDGAKVTITVNGVVVANATVENGKFSANVTANKVGNNPFTVSFAGDDTHTKSSVNSEFTVTKASTSIAINNISSVLVGEKVIISGNVTGIADGNKVTVAVNGKKANATVEKGKFSYTVTTNNKSSLGINNVTVSFAGNNTHAESSANTTFKIQIETSIDIHYAGTVEYGSDIIINASVTNIADGAKVTVIVNDVSKMVTVANGMVSVNVVANVIVGVNNVTVTFAGNDTHIKSSAKATFTVDKIPSSIIPFYIQTVLIGNNATIEGTVKGIDGSKINGAVAVIVNGVEVAKAPVKDGRYSANVVAGVMGVNNVTVIFAGDDTYLKSSANATFNVVKNPIKTSIAIDNIISVKFGENATISGNMTGIANGDKVTVAIIVNGVVVANATVENGKFSANVVAGVMGVNNVTVSFAGDGAYLKSSDKANFTVTKGSPSIVIDPINAVVGENVTVSGTIVPAVANITIIANGKTFNVTAKDGKFSVDIGSFDKEGIQTIVVKYDGNENYTAYTDSINVTVVKENATVSLTVPDVTLFFKNGTQLIIYLTYGGVNVSNETVKININGIDYTRTVVNGTAKFDINLAPGTYNAVVSLVSEKYSPVTTNATVTVLPVIKGNDTVLYFKNGTKYVALFLDGKGNPLAGAKIQFNINGVFYNRTTDANGTASLAINLAPGTYKITVTNKDNGAVSANNITVLPTIISENIVKYYKNETQYVVKVVDGKGNALANQTVEYNINGVFYNRTTDANGTATLTINLASGNSEPKDYIVTTWCNGCIVSNTVTVLPVLTAKDFNETFEAGKKFIANIVDGKGNPLAGAKIQFNINGVLYNRTSDVNGTVGLNINLAPGEYIITGICNDNGAVISNKVTVTPKV